jgi:hypothetical protein
MASDNLNGKFEKDLPAWIRVNHMAKCDRDFLRRGEALL